MRRWLARLMVGVVVALALLAAVGAGTQAYLSRRALASVAPPGQLASVGGHQLHLWCIGQGEPTVVLESGLGGGALQWTGVQAALSPTHRVCSYDRGGLGFSESGPFPRTAEQLAGELLALIDAADLGERVVLVGTSFGGIVVRAFAFAHQDRVAGIVLADSSHEDQRDRFAAANVPSGDLPQIMAHVMPVVAALGIPRLIASLTGDRVEDADPVIAGYLRATRFRTASMRAIAGEYGALPQSTLQLGRLRTRLNVPVIVLARTRGRDEAVERVWRGIQREHTTLSSRACLFAVPEAGHLIPRDQPLAVAAAIEEVVAATRGDRAPECDFSYGG